MRLNKIRLEGTKYNGSNSSHLILSLYSPTLTYKSHPNDVLMGENDLWHRADHRERIYGNVREAELMGNDEDSFGQTIRSEKDLWVSPVNQKSG